MTIGIIDYGMGNLRSIENAFEFLAAPCRLIRDQAEVASVDKLVLPGVGAFQKAMSNLRELELVDAIVDAARSGTPLLGICLGMQLLADAGEEGGYCDGLGLIRGTVRRLPGGDGIRVPHMGFNEVRFTRSCLLFDGVESGSHFYFTHSYYMDCEESAIAGSTSHGPTFTSVVAQGTVFGTQFHPEKSQSDGLRLLKNFCAMPSC